jgi:hypothetical protein
VFFAHHSGKAKPGADYQMFERVSRHCMTTFSPKRAIACVAVVLAAASALAGGGVAHAATAHPIDASHPANWHAQEKRNPFTGRMTHIYKHSATVDSDDDVFLLVDNDNTSYCIQAVTPNSGSSLVLEQCNTANDLQYFNFTLTTNGEAYAITDYSGYCLDDPSAADNVRINMIPCNGNNNMLWYHSKRDSDNAYQWQCMAASNEYITDDYGTVKDGAWIIALDAGGAGTFWLQDGHVVS